jgi:S1-C subfamily serine protease
MKNTIYGIALFAIAINFSSWTQTAMANTHSHGSLSKYQTVAVMSFNPIWRGEKRNSTVQACKNNRWFGGIGIAWVSPSKGGKNGYVERVLIDSPASKAGIIVGDYIKAIDNKHVRGVPNTVVTLEITRDGNTFYRDVLRSRICLLSD